MQSDVLVETSKYIESYMGTKNYTYHVIQTNIIPPHYVDVENLKRRRIQNRATKRNYSIRRYPHGTLYVREEVVQPKTLLLIYGKKISAAIKTAKTKKRASNETRLLYKFIFVITLRNLRHGFHGLQ